MQCCETEDAGTGEGRHGSVMDRGTGCSIAVV